MDSLTGNLLKNATLVQEQLDKAITSFLKSDKELAQKVIDCDNLVDEQEVLVEEECLAILALFRPLASQLRKTVSILKINNDLERIGDLSANIARRAKLISSDSLPHVPINLSEMGALSQEMLKYAIESFSSSEVGAARSVCETDLKIDAIHRSNYEAVYKSILKYPDHAEYLIQFISVSRYLERTGDLATNIAEDVIYLVEGSIVRHRDIS